ncbi:hypothetical protein HYQ40_07030 [Aerococcaceae bacterium DSM 111021]|nr:hypothetical protein [Aerococcaceae bacterium DSM 111021]
MAQSEEDNETEERVLVGTSDVNQGIIDIQRAAQWDDGVVLNKTDLENGHIDMSVSPDEASQTDWNTLFMYDYTERDIEDYDGVRFYIKNTSHQLLYISVVLNSTGSQQYEIDLGKSAWLQAENQDDLEVVYYEDGGFGIPTGFSGEFYLPLSAFSDSGRNPFTEVETIGVTFYVPSESDVLSFEMGDIHLLEDSVEGYGDTLQQLSISGEEAITIPNTGAVMTFYDATIEEAELEAEPIMFYLAEEYDGISISPAGKLEVSSSEAMLNSIVIYAQEPTTGTSVRQTIQLTPMHPRTAEVWVPQPSEVESYSSEWFMKLVDISPMLSIVIGSIAFLFGGLVWYWWGTYKQYQSVNYQLLKHQITQRKRLR